MKVRTLLATLAMALVLMAGAVAWAARPGEAAPDIQLPRVGGGFVSLGSLLGSGPVVVWFPDGSVNAATHDSLSRTAAANGATLLVIPVVGADPAAADGVAQRLPAAIVLHDANGSVTLGYSGEFIPGVSPRQNLFVVGTRGTVTFARFWPGVPEASLANELRTAR